MEDFITQDEAAELVGLSPHTLAAFRSTRPGGPPFYRVGVRSIRYKASDLRAWMQERSRVERVDPGAA